MKHGAKINLPDSQVASILCQTVYDGDVKTLRRLLKAKINANASDYDKRTAQHLACAEGNLTALKVLVEVGNVDLSVKDRWGHSLEHEAKSVGAGHVLDYLAEHNS